MEAPRSPEDLFIGSAVHWLRLGVEITGATVIGIGALVALVGRAEGGGRRRRHRRRGG